MSSVVRHKRAEDAGIEMLRRLRDEIFIEDRAEEVADDVRLLQAEGVKQSRDDLCGLWPIERLAKSARERWCVGKRTRPRPICSGQSRHRVPR